MVKKLRELAPGIAFFVLITGILATIVLFNVWNPWEESKAELVEESALEPPFSEILPTGEDLYIDLYFGSYRTDEFTLYFSDGSVLHYRYIGNEDSWTIPDESKDLKPASLAMAIYVYESEEQAINKIKDERMKSWITEEDIEFYAELFNFPLEDIVGSVIIWVEPSGEISGREEIFFRLGRYVASYGVEVTPAPKIEDGYFIPPELSDLLRAAVQITIPRLYELTELQDESTT